MVCGLRYGCGSQVGDDLASYLVESEQSNSALGLGVSIHKDASVRAAGGFLIQVFHLSAAHTDQGTDMKTVFAVLRVLPSSSRTLGDVQQPCHALLQLV